MVRHCSSSACQPARGRRGGDLGDDVYVQGIGTADTDTWIKGTNDGSNTYTFANGQYLGTKTEEYEDATYYNMLFLMGNTGSAVTNLTMTYDPETGIFTTTNYLVENADYTDKLYYNVVFAPGAQLVPASSPDAIAEINAKTDADADAVRFNIAGQRVGKNYKGIVVEKGRKTLRK